MDVFGSTLSSKRKALIDDNYQAIKNNLSTYTKLIDDNILKTERLEHKIRILEYNLIELQTKNGLLENKLIELTEENLKKFQSLAVAKHEMNNTIKILENKNGEIMDSIHALYNIYHNEQTHNSDSDVEA